MAGSGPAIWSSTVPREMAGSVAGHDAVFRSSGLKTMPMRLSRAMTVWALLLWPAAVFALPQPDRVAALSRGINITGWFRYPARRDPAVLTSWMSDTAMADLRTAGFTFVRLAIDPAIIDGAPMRGVLLE